MKSLLFVSLLALCALCLAVSGGQGRFLAAEEASLVFGGYDDYECREVAECDDYDPNVYKCPTGSGSCTQCEDVLVLWQECTVLPEQICTEDGPFGDCGHLRYGSCSGSTCTMTLPTGQDCDLVPQCHNGE